MQKFNSINLEAKFIKNILQNTYIPTMPIVTDGDYIVKGSEYCYRNQIIKCKETGTLMGSGYLVDGIQYVPRTDNSGDSPSASDGALCSVKFICGAGIRSATYDVVANLNSHTHIPGLTHNYKSSTPKYDSETHRYLGAYLRWYRDVYGINLLPLYNCFCGESFALAHIKDNKLMDGYDATKNVSIVPIQLNKKYTVFVSSSHNVSMCGAFLNSNGRILDPITNQCIDELLGDKVRQFVNSSYNHPIEYSAFTDDPKLVGYTNQFYLIIQTEAQQFCPIVVLEGSYTSFPDRFVTSRETYENNENLGIDYSLFKPNVQPSMTIVPTSYHIPYSYRLIEFLLENVITKNEDIPKNVARIQERLDIRNNDDEFTDVWNDEMRFIVHNEYFKYSDKHYLKSHQLNKNHEPIVDLTSLNRVGLKDRLVYGKKAPTFVLNTYYTCAKDNDGEYHYQLLTSKPINWDIDYSSYYTYSTELGFKPVASVNGDVIGLKNCNPKKTFDTKYDITGYIDKDVENKLFEYRSV